MANQNLSNTVNFKNFNVDDMVNINAGLKTTVTQAIGHGKMTGDTEEKVWTEELHDAITNNLVDGGTYTFANYKPKTSIVNYPQIVQSGAKVSKSTQVSDEYGIDDALDAETFLVEKAMQHKKEGDITGYQKKLEGDSVSVANVSGGMGAVLNDNVALAAINDQTVGTSDFNTTYVEASVSDALDKDDFFVVQKQIVEEGGDADKAYMNTGLFSAVSKFSGQEVRNSEASAKTVFQATEILQGAYGPIFCKWSTFMEAKVVLILDITTLQVSSKRPIMEKDVDNSTTDYFGRTVLEEYTLRCKSPKASGIIFDRHAA